MDFCSKFNLVSMQASESTLLLFMAHLGEDGLTHKTIKLYLAAARHLHVLYGQQLGGTGRDLCPVAALIDYINMSDYHEGFPTL